MIDPLRHLSPRSGIVGLLAVAVLVFGVSPVLADGFQSEPADGAGAGEESSGSSDRQSDPDLDLDIDIDLDGRDWDSFDEDILLAVQKALVEAEKELEALERQDFGDLPSGDALSLEAMKAAEMAREQAMARVNEALAEAEKIRQEEFDKAKAEIARARAEIRAALAELRAHGDESNR